MISPISILRRGVGADYQQSNIKGTSLAQKPTQEVLERVSSFNHWILWQCLNYWLYSKNRSSDNTTTLKDQIRPAKNAIFTKWLSESLKKKLRSQQVVCKFYEFLRNRSKERQSHHKDCDNSSFSLFLLHIFFNV